MLNDRALPEAIADAALDAEQALEITLPFLQRAQGHFRLLPVEDDGTRP